MKSYLVKTPKFVQWIFHKRIWAFPNSTNTIYLTFDDGPIPGVTPWVLDVLKTYNAKATFFCVGNNVKKHPEIFQQIIADGHSAGNHSYHHLKGSKTTILTYLEDVALAEAEMNRWMDTTTKEKLLFRPPYGKLKLRQSWLLQKKGYKIIMWDVLSADFDTSISKEKCLQNVLKNINSGSIVVFHDSLKAEKNLRYVLPKVLEFISEKGWKFESIV